MHETRPVQHIERIHSFVLTFRYLYVVLPFASLLLVAQQSQYSVQCQYCARALQSNTHHLWNRACVFVRMCVDSTEQTRRRRKVK